MLLDSVLKSLRWFSNKATVATLRDFNNRMRLFATESRALQKLRVRDMVKNRYLKKRHAYKFLLIIPVSSFGLGTWQVFRKFEKDKEIAELLENTNQPPVDLPKDLGELKDMEFHVVRVKGRFDHSKEIYLGPRPRVEELGFKSIPSLLSHVKGGYLVITPFILSDRDLTILVNRGWVPPKKKLPKNRPEGQITEEVEIVGLVRNQEKRLPFGAKNRPKEGIWVYRDLENMCEVTGADPVFIDADLASTVPGGPLGGQTLVHLPNNHVSYIITWYSLSAVTFYMWYLKTFQRLNIIV